MPVRPLRRVATAASVAGILLVAGCSSSGSNRTSSTGGNHLSASAIPIGEVGDFSGALASSIGGVPKALDAWATSINAADGLNGHPVKIIVKDVGSGTASAGLTDVESLITDDHVAALIDYDSNDATWMKYAATKNVPVIEPVGESAAPLTTSNAFPLSYSYPVTAFILASLAKTLGPKLGLAYCAESPGCAGFTSLFTPFGQALGVSLAVSAPLSSSAPDYTAFCQKLIDSQVNSYVLLQPTATSSKITQQCHDQGVKAPQLLFAYAALDSWKTDPAYTNDPVFDFMAAPFWDTSVASVATMRAAFAKYESGLIGSQYDNTYAESGWAAGQFLSAAAAQIKGDITSASLKAAFFGMKDETLDGLTAPLNFNQSAGTSINCYYTWEVANGKFTVPAGGSKPTCAPSSLIDPLLQAIIKSAS